MSYEEDRFSKAQRTTAVASLEAAHEAAVKEVEANNIQLVFPAGLVGYWGEYGAGKSVSCAGYLADAYAQGVPVFANKGALDFGGVIDDLKFQKMEYFDCILHWDEIEGLLNSLRSNSELQVDLISGAIQLRHQGVQIITAGQDPDEINPRWLKRYQFSIYCEKSWEGKWWEIEHIITRNPGSRRKQRTWHETAVRMDRYMPLYGSWRRTEVGSHRITKATRTARLQIEQGTQLERIMKGAFDQKLEVVTVEAVQESLSVNFGTELTDRAIGKRLRARGYTPKKIGTLRLAGFITKHPNQVADPVEEITQ